MAAMGTQLSDTESGRGVRSMQQGPYTNTLINAYHYPPPQAHQALCPSSTLITHTYTIHPTFCMTILPDFHTLKMKAAWHFKTQWNTHLMWHHFPMI